MAKHSPSSQLKVASIENAAGGGIIYEDRVATSSLLALLTESNWPGLANGVITHVKLQRRAFGVPLDDLTLDIRLPSGKSARADFQIKRKLTISSSKTNKDFREVIDDGWQTLSQDDFREGFDRIGVVTDDISITMARTLDRICKTARNQHDTTDVVSRFGESGSGSSDELKIWGVVLSLLREFAEREVTDAEVHRFFSHFLLINSDLGRQGSTADAADAERARHALEPSQADKAGALLATLRTLVQDTKDVAATFERFDVLDKVSCDFPLRAVRSLRQDVEALVRIADSTVGGIRNDVGGEVVPRESSNKALSRAFESCPVVLIEGPRGTGKSALLRQHVQRTREQRGSLICLAADRLAHRSWIEFATAHGLSSISLSVLLDEVASVGVPVLYLDAIDRLESDAVPLVSEILRCVLGCKTCAHWRIVATLRSENRQATLEKLPELRKLAPHPSVVAVTELDDEEAEWLAGVHPALGPLLLSNSPARTIARRPFFAQVLLELAADADETSATAKLVNERDLMVAWWRRGGYNATSTGTGVNTRHRVLLAIARTTAANPADAVSLSSLESALIDGAMDPLVRDGVLVLEREGLAVRFVHDIFFEWAFAYCLRETGAAAWQEIVSAGMRPLLERAFELHSTYLCAEPDRWHAMLLNLESLANATSWRHTWLLGPLLSEQPLFKEYFDYLMDPDSARLEPFLAYVLAEKTVPNPRLLESGDRRISRQQAYRYATPSDPMLWIGLISLLLARKDELVPAVVPRVIQVFEIWLNLTGAQSDVLTCRIAAVLDRWVRQAETTRIFEDELTLQCPLPSSALASVLLASEKQLRERLLTTIRQVPTRVTAYLEHLLVRVKLGETVPEEVFDFASWIAPVAGSTLRKLTEAEFDRPKSCGTRNDRSGEHYGLADSLTIRWLPPAPTREPFAALLEHDVDEGLALISGLANSATSHWQNCCKSGLSTRRTPLPVIIDFPWGEKSFWGGFQEYSWSRADPGTPPVLGTAFLSLARWAFERLDSGVDPEQVVRRVVEGHDSVAVLGLALAIVREHGRPTDTGRALLSCLKLWDWDLSRYTSEVIYAHPICLQSGDEDHLEALRALGERQAYKSDPRILVLDWLYGSNGESEGALRASVRGFASELPYEFEEDQADMGIQRHLEAMAKNFAAMAEIENMAPMANEEGRPTLFQYVSPAARTSEGQARIREINYGGRVLQLNAWVTNRLEGELPCENTPDEFTMASAIEFTRTLDTDDLFKNWSVVKEDVYHAGPAVAGVATLVLQDIGESKAEDLAWAFSVVERVVEASCEEDDYIRDDQEIHIKSSSHPATIVVRGLGVRIANGKDKEHARRLLLQLTGHPRHDVLYAVLHELFAHVENHPRLAWSGLQLALESCSRIDKRGELLPEIDTAERQNYHRLQVGDALERLQNKRGVFVTSLPRPVGRSDVRRSRDETELSADPFDTAADYYQERPWLVLRASLVVTCVPFRQLGFIDSAPANLLSYASQVVEWFIEKASGHSFADQDGLLIGDIQETELQRFGEMIGRFYGYLDRQQARTMLLAPILDMEDGPCMQLLAPFARGYVNEEILLPPILPEDAAAVIKAIVTRVSVMKLLNSKGPGRVRLHMHDTMQELIKTLLFVRLKSDLLTARFANGTWGDLSTFLSALEPILELSHDNENVFEACLLLYERSGEAIGLDTIVRHLAPAIRHRSHLERINRDDDISTRVADLIRCRLEQLTGLLSKETTRALRDILELQRAKGHTPSAETLRVTPFRNFAAENDGK